MEHEFDLVALAESGAKLGAIDSAAARVVGGLLGKASKMPGHTYGLSALDCITGSQLRNVPGSVCAGPADSDIECYAMGGFYTQENVKAAHARRIASLGHPDWVAAQAWLWSRAEGSQPHSKPSACGYGRWHDSGDIQSVEHFAAICAVARETEDVEYWIPTRETGIVREYLRRGGVIPPNLNVRISNHMVGETFKEDPLGLAYSTVGCDDAADAHQCPSLDQGNSCGDCRACWDPSVRWVNYRLH
jgi:hypothetical protein